MDLVNKVIDKFFYNRNPYKIIPGRIFTFRFSVGKKRKLWFLTRIFCLKISFPSMRIIFFRRLDGIVPKALSPILPRLNPRFLEVIDYSLRELKQTSKKDHLDIYTLRPNFINKINFFIKEERVALSFKKVDFGAYGHFLAEYFPAIVLLHKKFPLTLFVESDSSLKNLLVSFATIYDIEYSFNSDPDFKSVDFSVLSEKYNIKVSNYCEYPSYLGIRLFLDNLKTQVDLPVPSEYIYVGRKSGTSSGRRLINELNLVKTLLNIGFKVVYPEDYSFENQVLIFSMAKVVVGVSGSALQNCTFCQEGSTVIEICPDTDIRPGVFTTAMCSKCDFRLVIGATLTEHQIDGKPEEFVVVVDDVLSILAKLIPSDRFLINTI